MLIRTPEELEELQLRWALKLMSLIPDAVWRRLRRPSH